MTITDVDRSSLCDILEKFANGNLTSESCCELAYFLEDCFCDGIELDRLRLIAEETREFADVDELTDHYLSNEDLDELNEECDDNDDLVNKIIEKIEEDYCATVLRTSDGFIVIE